MKRVFKTGATFGIKETMEAARLISVYEAGSAYMGYGKYVSILNMSTFWNSLQGPNLNDSRPNNIDMLFILTHCTNVF